MRNTHPPCVRHSQPDPNRCEWSEATCAYAAQALPADEAAAAKAHIAVCPDCRRELE
ncbi:MAG: zf-HC2 domain-containing protein, partial [Alphaproteobacteria bacterium]